MGKLNRFLPLALVVLQWGCGGNKKENDDSQEAVPVQVAKVGRETIQRVVTADAVFYAVNQSGVTPKISAPVRRFLVNRGDHVQKGQLLAELEDGDLAAAVTETRALYEQAQAQYLTTTKGTLPEDMTKAQTDVDSARQALDAAGKLYDHRVALVREGALAQKLADDAKVSLVLAQSQLDTTKRHLESLQTVSREQEIQSAKGQVEAAKARFAGAQAQLSYAAIRSPIDGIVADRPANAGEMAASGAPLITIVDISSIVARANVPVGEIAGLKVGQPATIAAAEGNRDGKVIVVSPEVDAASTTVEVWVRIANPGGDLKPGATAKVSIVAGTITNAIVIPATALVSSGEGETEVIVVGADSLAHEQKVAAGVRQGGKVQIEEGLNGGENVVIAGGAGLADKAKVRVETNAGPRD